jgi:hypothetical protein
MKKSLLNNLFIFFIFNLKYYLILYRKVIFYKKKINANNYLIITQEFGGLGDHLLYSHIPRLAKQSGHYSKVFISEFSEYRNLIYKEAVWSSNPYVDGFVFSFDKLYRSNYKLVKSNQVLSTKLAALYGLPTIVDNPPEIYYNPHYDLELSQYKNKIILDLNSLSWRPDLEDYSKLKTKLFELNLEPDFQFISNDGINLFNIPLIDTKSFDEFYNIVKYSKSVICFPTGTAMLSIALKKNTFVFYSNDLHNDFIYNNHATYILL